jgi:MFS family permease
LSLLDKENLGSARISVIMDKRRRIPIFLAATAMFWASLYTYVPILSPYAQDMGASLGMVGLIVAAYGLSQLLLRVPTGIVSDRRGRRRPFIIIGHLAAIVAAAGMAVAKSPGQLLICRGMAGVAATTWVAFTVLFPAYFAPDETARAMSILLFCNQSAQLSATYLGGWSAELWGWKAPFVAAVILGLIGLGLSFLIQEVPLRREQTLSLGELLQVGKSPQLLVVSLLAALIQYVVFVTVYGFTPTYAAAIGASKAQLGMLTLVSSIPSALAALLGGTWLARHLGERRVVVGGFCLAGVTTLAIPFIESVAVLSVTQAIGGIGRGAIFPVLMGMSIRTIPTEKRATAMGFFQSIYALGMTGGPAVSGFLGDLLGLRGIFMSAGIVGLASAVLAMFVLKSRVGLPKPARARDLVLELRR